MTNINFKCRLKFLLASILPCRHARKDYNPSVGTGDISEFQYLLSQPGLDVNIYDKDVGILFEQRYYM